MISFKQLFHENDGTSASRFFSQDALKGVGGFKSRSLLVEMPLDDFLNLAQPLPEDQQREDAEKWHHSTLNLPMGCKCSHGSKAT